MSRFAAATLALLLVGCAPAAEPPAVVAAAAPVRPAVRVRVAPAERAPLDEPVRWTGLVRSERSARVSAELPGRLVAREVERGDEVAEGQVLCRLDDSKLRIEADRARAALRNAEQQATYAAAELARGEQLGDALASSALDKLRHGAELAAVGREQAEVAVRAAERALRDTVVRAPFAGVVADRHAEVGDTVAPGVPLVSLVSIDPILVQVGVSVAEAARLEPGAEAGVALPDLGGQVVVGTLLSVARVPDPRTGTYIAEYRVANPGGALREGMVAHVVVAASPTPTLLVPRDALVQQDGAPAVYVVEDDAGGTVARLRGLHLGRQGVARAEVLSGLPDGARVVVEGQFALADGAPVAVDGEE